MCTLLQNKWIVTDLCLSSPALSLQTAPLVTRPAMASKRFSIANMEARGSVRKQARLDGNAALVAAIRPWGSAFWVFEGEACIGDLAKQIYIYIHIYYIYKYTYI